MSKLEASGRVLRLYSLFSHYASSEISGPRRETRFFKSLEQLGEDPLVAPQAPEGMFCEMPIDRKEGSVRVFSSEELLDI